ncbi:hypothetical protein VTI74DRAFT_8958 [Chaetomium olivicolor]
MKSTSELVKSDRKLGSATEALAAEISHQGKRIAAPGQLSAAERLGHIYDAERALLSNMARIQAMLRQPTDFLRGLALHTQVLACLQWLCEFQVLACVPLDDSVPFKDVADICGVPEAQLCRVTRLMATAGFLQEPRPGHIAHSALSAQFVTEPALLDAALFLSEIAAPAALKMPLATKKFGASDRPDQSAYALAFDTDVPLSSVFQLRPRLQRQFATYLSFVTSDDQANIRDVLMRIDWASLGNATVVDVGAHSPASAINLATLFPSLHFVVQTYESSSSSISTSSSSSSSFIIGGGCLTTTTTTADSPEIPAHLTSRITLQTRHPGTPQFVRTAAVYILHLPSPSPSLPWDTIAAHAVSELAAHADVLRANPGSRLILTALVLASSHSQGTGTGNGAVGVVVDAEAEAAARVRDLSLLQLANGRHAERGEVVELLGRVGGLVVTDEITRGEESAVVAWEVRFQGQGVGFDEKR